MPCSLVLETANGDIFRVGDDVIVGFKDDGGGWVSSASGTIEHIGAFIEDCPFLSIATTTKDLGIYLKNIIKIERI